MPAVNPVQDTPLELTTAPELPGVPDAEAARDAELAPTLAARDEARAKDELTTREVAAELPAVLDDTVDRDDAREAVPDVDVGGPPEDEAGGTTVVVGVP